MSTANEIQVGGDHYKGILQHWDVVALYKVDYFIGNATAYFVRWRKKNGIEDLEKAVHYLLKREQDYHHKQKIIPSTILNVLAKSYDLVDQEPEILKQLFNSPAFGRTLLQNYIVNLKAQAIQQNHPGTPEDGGHHSKQGEE